MTEQLVRRRQNQQMDAESAPLGATDNSTSAWWNGYKRAQSFKNTYGSDNVDTHLSTHLCHGVPHKERHCGWDKSTASCADITHLKQGLKGRVQQ